MVSISDTGAGKTKYVDCLLKEMEKDPRPSLINKKVIRDSKNLYTIDDYLEDATLVRLCLIKQMY